MLYSDENQMQNLGPLENSTSGDRASGHFSHNRGKWNLAGIRTTRTDIRSMNEVIEPSARPSFAVAFSVGSFLPKKREKISRKRSNVNRQPQHRAKLKLHYIGHESCWQGGIQRGHREGAS